MFYINTSCWNTHGSCSRFHFSKNVMCPSLDSESHFMAGAEWKAHSHESKSLNSPPATQSSSSHHFGLFSVLLCLSAPLVTALRAQSAPAPVLSRPHSHTRGNYYCPGKSCLLDCSLSLSLYHRLTHSCM